MANVDRFLFVSILALRFSVCLCSLSLSCSLSPCPVPLIPNEDCFLVVVVVVMMVGVHDEVMFAAESVKKEQKNKRKTQKLGWL